MGLPYLTTGGSVVRNSPANAGYTGSIPGSGRFPGEGNGNSLSILAWKIPWMEEPGRLQSMGSQRDTTQRLHSHFLELDYGHLTKLVPRELKHEFLPGY